MSRIFLMNDALIAQFIKLISATTGLHIREQDRDALQKKILLRMKFLKLSAPEEYYQLLEAGTNLNPTLCAVQSEYEWKELTLLLTIGESYFFRDRGQFQSAKKLYFAGINRTSKAHAFAADLECRLFYGRRTLFLGNSSSRNDSRLGTVGYFNFRN